MRQPGGSVERWGIIALVILGLTVAPTLCLADEDDSTTEDGFPAEVVGWSLLGAGVGSAAVSVALSSQIPPLVDEVNGYDKRAPGASREELEQMKRRANGLYDGSITTGVVAGVLVAGGVGFLTHAYTGDERASESAWRPAVRFGHRGAFIGAHRRF
ncbi:MAG: hypothetical protein ACOCV2_08045 [Persicimonas sp.]